MVAVIFLWGLVAIIALTFYTFGTNVGYKKSEKLHENDFQRGLIQGRREGYSDGKQTSFAKKAFFEHFNQLNPDLAQQPQDGPAFISERDRELRLDSPSLRFPIIGPYGENKDD